MFVPPCDFIMIYLVSLLIPCLCFLSLLNKALGKFIICAWPLPVSDLSIHLFHPDLHDWNVKHTNANAGAKIRGTTAHEQARNSTPYFSCKSGATRKNVEKLLKLAFVGLFVQVCFGNDKNNVIVGLFDHSRSHSCVLHLMLYFHVILCLFTCFFDAASRNLTNITPLAYIYQRCVTSLGVGPALKTYSCVLWTHWTYLWPHFNNSRGINRTVSLWDHCLTNSKL